MQYILPNHPVESFVKYVGHALDTYAKFFLACDFNTEETGPCLSEFLTSFYSKNLVKDKTCFKNPENPNAQIFLSQTVASGLIDFHKLIVTVCKTSSQKSQSKEILYRDYKNFDMNTFKNVLRL